MGNRTHTESNIRTIEQFGAYHSTQSNRILFEYLSRALLPVHPAFSVPANSAVADWHASRRMTEHSLALNHTHSADTRTACCSCPGSPSFPSCPSTRKTPKNTSTYKLLRRTGNRSVHAEKKLHNWMRGTEPLFRRRTAFPMELHSSMQLGEKLILQRRSLVGALSSVAGVPAHALIDHQTYVLRHRIAIPPSPYPSHRKLSIPCTGVSQGILPPCPMPCHAVPGRRAEAVP
jgi:hypothetical protein